jgi:lipopolysaccharide transport system ATP-binding protein
LNTVIKLENISKQYRLGEVGTGSLAHDVNRAWYRIRGKEDPYLKVGDVNDRSVKGESELVWALRNIGFEVKQGEVLGIIGKNGAGKSTLLKILSQVTTPTTGKIKVKGRIASLLEVGTGFHPDLTGLENIFLNGAILGMTKLEIKSKLDEIIDFSGVQKYIDTPVKRYSSGMLVRLGFAVAAHLEPEILIVDEVLAVGDAEFQKKCLGKMQDVSNQGRTVLFVSHNMSSVLRLCNNAVLLSKGEILSTGSTEDVVRDYLSSKQNELRIASNATRQIKVVDLLFLNSNDQEIDACSTYDFVKIKMKCIAQQRMEMVSMAVCFNDIFDLRITSLWSAFKSDLYTIEAGEFEVEFIIPSIKLIPGDYEVIVYIDSKGVVVERIDGIKKITVSYTKKFGLVAEPTSVHGLYLEDYDIIYKPVNVLESK